MPEALLSVRGLMTRFATEAGPIHPSNGLDLELAAGEALGLVGESGSGKSVTARASVRLLAPESAVREGTIRYRGQDLRALEGDALRALRAREIAMIVQDPAAALNPVMTVGDQITRIHRLQTGSTAAEARATALALLARLRIADPALRLDAYPHQLSGGMKQRILIAMALICRPKLLIADEPTTALDVTVEAEILDLLAELRREMGMAILLISHNLSVVARLCERVAVMYAGRIVETGPTRAVLAAPRHPYTRALLGSVPQGTKHERALPAIPGEPPDLARLPPGCAFAPRCPEAETACTAPQAL
ncbi:MAG: ABC transporter ATP-binding protein [Alphaproteobacteria bacterium]|nr:ABC transporter ATP-binding protein [Alphaproteobacteria bacterium]